MDIQGTVRDILKDKGDQAWKTRENATVYEAIGLMGEHNIGALIVVNDKDEVVGVMTERDYSRKVVLKGRTSRDTKVSEIVNKPAITVKPCDKVTHCMALMSNERIRHLPVMDEGKLIGMVSMGDIMRWVMASQESTIDHLKGYIFGGY
ncbi:MAG: CBS domain-containing protein [Akkermansiaceae bacterium]|nr:CBS domain-containing protein [Akkermansiaceae bacterium]